MKKNLTFTFIFSLIICTTLAQDYRYVKTIFPGVDKTSGVIYGSAAFLNSPYVDETSTTTQNLLMDIYQPQEDDLTQRPTIVFTHGGGFFQGNRTVDDMVAFCDSFARKGYVTVSIDYRQGVEVFDNGDMHYTRAAYRGLQDGKTAVRFLRANAATYGINVDIIYFDGNSAGSFVGLNALYMDDDELPIYVGEYSYSNPLPPFNTIIAPDLGLPDIGENLTYIGKPDAVMACWGGVGDTLTIESDNPQPVFLIHGTADAVVPFNSGPPFGLTNISAVYGSNAIDIRRQDEGLPAAETYFVEGEDHEFYGVDNGMWSNGSSGNAYWDTIVIKATDFFWQQHRPTSVFEHETADYTVIFHNNSQGAFSSLWDFGDGNTSNAFDPSHTYTNEGDYLVTLYIENEVLSWDTVSHIVSVPMVSVKEHENTSFSIYPNPCSDAINICFEQNLKNYDLELYSIAGQLILKETNKSANHLNINMSEMEAGIYFIRIISNKNSSMLKLIKN